MENLTELGSKIWTTDGPIQAQHCTTTNPEPRSLKGFSFKIFFQLILYQEDKTILKLN